MSEDMEDENSTELDRLRAENMILREERDQAEEQEQELAAEVRCLRHRLASCPAVECHAWAGPERAPMTDRDQLDPEVEGMIEEAYPSAVEAEIVGLVLSQTDCLSSESHRLITHHIVYEQLRPILRNLVRQALATALPEGMEIDAAVAPYIEALEAHAPNHPLLLRAPAPVAPTPQSAPPETPAPPTEPVTGGPPPVTSREEEATRPIHPTSLGDEMGARSPRGRNRGEVATPASVGGPPVPSAPASEPPTPSEPE